MIGAGKYDSELTKLREAQDAEGAVLIIYHGRHGNGISVQGPLELHAELPDLLRRLADSIEADMIRMLAAQQGEPS